MVFPNHRIGVLSGALKAAEDLSAISSINIANSNTLGYKALEGRFIPTCYCQCFEDALKDAKYGRMQLEIGHDLSPGEMKEINGKQFETSNVNVEKELQNMVSVAMMTRGILAAVQVENRLQQEVLNLAQ